MVSNAASKITPKEVFVAVKYEVTRASGSNPGMKKWGCPPPHRSLVVYFMYESLSALNCR